MGLTERERKICDEIVQLQHHIRTHPLPPNQRHEKTMRLKTLYEQLTRACLENSNARARIAESNNYIESRARR